MKKHRKIHALLDGFAIRLYSCSKQIVNFICRRAASSCAVVSWARCLFLRKLGSDWLTLSLIHSLVHLLSHSQQGYVIYRWENLLA